MDDDQVLAAAPDEPADAAPDVPDERLPVEGRPSRWVALAFVGLLSALVLLGTTGVGEAAATLLGGPEVVCGGP